MRIAFLGTPDAAVPSLRALLDAPDVEVVAVITNPDRPRGRGHKLSPPPVKVVAAEAGVPVWQPERPREILAELAALDLDACAVVAYGALLPPDVLAVGGRGFVNLHFSLLPAWRGAAPVQRSVLAGDAETGVSCFVLEAGMDTGPVLATARTPVGVDETAGELTARLADLGAPVLVDAIRGLVDASLTPVPQDHDLATYAPKITPDDARLDWSADADAVARAVRAFNPVPGAHTRFAGNRLKVHRATVIADGPSAADDGSTGVEAGQDTDPLTAGQAEGGPVASGPPGTVVAIAADGSPVVACGRGALRLDEVQPAGKPRMDGTAFANGYRPLGARLGHDGHDGHDGDDGADG